MLASRTAGQLSDADLPSVPASGKILFAVGLSLLNHFPQSVRNPVHGIGVRFGSLRDIFQSVRDVFASVRDVFKSAGNVFVDCVRSGKPSLPLSSSSLAFASR